MAIVYATKNGNWSDTTVWNTGALPTAADDVYSNNFTVNINDTFTVNSIRNYADTGVTAGGYFNALNGSNLTCNATPGVVGAVTGVATYQFNDVNAGTSATLNAYCQPLASSVVVDKRSVSLNTGGTLYINGTLNGFSSSVTVPNFQSVVYVTAGKLTVNGSVWGGSFTTSASVSAGIYMANLAGDVTVVGNVYAPLTGLCYSINNASSTGSVYVTGNVFGVGYYSNGSVVNAAGGINSYAAIFGPRVYVTGNVYGSNFTAASSNNGASYGAITSTQFSVTGNVYGGGQFATYTSSAMNPGVAANGTGTVVGDLYGGYQPICPAIYCMTGTVTHTGTVYASAFAPAIQGSTGTIITSGPFVDNAAGIPALGGKYTMPANAAEPTASYFKGVAPSPIVQYTLYGATYFSSKSPVQANVRSGTVYGLTNEKTGTLALPQAANVQYGIVYDANTVGTLDIGAQVWNKLLSGTYDTGSIGALMKNVSTVPVTAAQISALK